jgi:glyoxylase-like metal-dependent hydrolase (beta-lactamase superfamily II)
MKSMFLLLALLLCACASIPPADPTGNTYMSETLAPGVHLLRQRDPFHVQPRGNVLVVEQWRGVVLIDSGGTPAGAEEVIAFVRARTSKPVAAIVLTHWHGDHVLGAERLIQEWPEARYISAAATRDHLASPVTSRFMPSDNPETNAAIQANIMGAVGYFQTEASNAALSENERQGFADAVTEITDYAHQMTITRSRAPAEAFTATLLLDDPERPIELRFLGRANTDGDATAWLPRQNLIATGDIVVAPVPYAFGSYPGEWRAVLRTLREADSVLIPGHGAPLRDDAYVDRLIALIEAGRTQVAALVTQGLTDEEVHARIDLSAERAFFVGDDPWLKRWFDAYWTEPFVTSALKEARGVPIVQGE